MITIGIDIGGSTTKIIGIENGALKTPMLVTSSDPIASLFGAFGKFIDSNTLALSDIDRIMITGVGSSFVTRRIYGLPTGQVEEFLANGLGGLYLSGLDKAIIVSMGTGTALVQASGGQAIHIGGTGIGGGTIVGLASRLLNVHDISNIVKMAREGDLSRVDLMVGDITKDVLPGLPPYTTASNFGKISDLATPGDIALGILNLVFQSIGMTAVFAVKSCHTNDVVLIGNLSTLPQCHEMFRVLQELFGVRFIIPENSEYATALGAALAFVSGRDYKEIG